MSEPATAPEMTMLVTPGAYRREVVMISGDPRPAGNTFGLEAAIVRQILRLIGVVVHEASCVDLAEVRDLLDRRCPVVLHVMAHSQYGGVVLSVDGDPLSFEHERFTQEITGSRFPPRLTVLSVCSSVPAALLLSQTIETVIAWPGQVDDEQMRAFARHLYGHLAKGHSVQDAFALACTLTCAKSPELTPPLLYGSSDRALFH
ncbi:hypothetical protein [Nonomuraea sp. NPDC003754]